MSKSNIAIDKIDRQSYVVCLFYSIKNLRGSSLYVILYTEHTFYLKKGVDKD